MSATVTTNGRRRSESPSPAETAARVEELATLVDELAQAVAERAAAGGGHDGGQPPLYTNVEDWVREYLLVNFSRPFGEVGGQRWCWCEQWWRHNEAVTALTALWYAWEHARLEPTGMLGWLREQHYHLGVICSADGPFRQCAQTDGDRAAKHTGDTFADVVPAPEDWWNWWGDDE
ncbi:MAG: hypothetical protein JWP76_2874 [Dactylosporangium sp.]|jgi:hypothetical protein|nr:hypothetical protein [Dactylosporangium sp.]